ncbi:SseB family protein [Natronosporangium hydrolyticum]|uniref:SseB family protein n=1 Tax=Natronosporangium hydrolyticum TaxID=2811111 RepID=A0A895YC20_9ACTN|nr:SseB family protein [Natronosporangium hydrolyticum]QSB15327.1 SseB family protein [Natronosporangium hydrolyticum]
MTSEQWRPGAPVESAMAEALQAGDWPRYAELLGSTPLLVTDAPAAGAPAAEQLSGLLPPDGTYVVAYTSVATLTAVFGPHAPSYEALELAALRQRWPDPDYQLAVNAGTPIGVFLPLPAIDQLATGATSLVSYAQLAQAVGQELLDRVRSECLRDLSGVESTPDQLRPDPALNPVEEALRAAADSQDSEAFLTTLLFAELVLPTAEPVDDPELLYGDEFPWRVTGADTAPAVPVFSSVAMLERTGAPPTDRLEAHALDVLANWPGDEYSLILNPGSITELILPGETVRELVTAVLQVGPAGSAAGEGP